MRRTILTLIIVLAGTAPVPAAWSGEVNEKAPGLPAAVAAHYQATYFRFDNGRWNELVKTYGEDELWKVNEAFLKKQIEEGKQIVLSHDPATTTGWFNREVQHLRRLGYRFIQDGWVWKAVR